MAESNPEKTGSTDNLTGLINRVGLEGKLKALDLSEAKALSVVSVEISRFGNVSDSMGAELGNKIIAMTAKRLTKMFPTAVFIGRTHGDHFCLVFKDQQDLEEQLALLQDFTQRPFAVRGQVIVLSVRVGVALWDPAAEEPQDLLHSAEIALHRAKREGLKVCFFDQDMKELAKERHKLENDLRVSLATRHVELHKALSNDEFELVYQPIVNVRNGTIHACEALIRWTHPDRGFVSPAEFIPMAEQIQIMDVLGSWILRKACADAMAWPANDDGSEVGVSVNVSPTQFVESRLLVASVKQAIEESGICPSRLKLEITESTAFATTMVSVLEELKALGCTIALDDFGTGYSSLTQLNDLPLDYVKLDQSFIRQIGSDDTAIDQHGTRLSKAVIALCTSFDQIAIVEGVETKHQLTCVTDMGADLVQGYYFSQPLKMPDILTFLNQWKY